MDDASAMAAYLICNRKLYPCSMAVWNFQIGNTCWQHFSHNVLTLYRQQLCSRSKSFVLHNHHTTHLFFFFINKGKKTLLTTRSNDFQHLDMWLPLYTGSRTQFCTVFTSFTNTHFAPTRCCCCCCCYPMVFVCNASFPWQHIRHQTPVFTFSPFWFSWQKRPR